MKYHIVNFSFLISILFIFSCKTTKVDSIKSNLDSVNSFEGIIKYKFLIKNIEGMSESEIEEELIKSEKVFGRHMTHLIKGKNMKAIMDGAFMKITTYTDGTDSMVVHSVDLGDIEKVSTSKDWNFTYDTIVKSNEIKLINNIECKLISFVSDDYTWNYYYNENYSADPLHYKDYVSCFWNKAIEETLSLPLRFEGKIPGGYIYMEAEEIISEKLDDNIFNVPEEK